MKEYEVAGILTYRGQEMGLMLIDIENRVGTPFTDNEIKEKIIEGEIQIRGVTLVNDEIVIENKDALGAFDVTKDEDLSIFRAGNRLLDVVDRVKDYNKRYLFKWLTRWVDGRRAPLIATLYGLKGTGKTVLLLQICDHYIKLGKKVAYASLTVDTDNDKFVKELARLVDERYDLVVIDEITYLEGFLGWGNRLSDDYARRGVKIIVSGTQSLMLKAASYDILFDRMEMFNTTYISYQEYKSLYSNATVLDYVRCGGLLSESGSIKEDSLEEYIDTAIIGNIKHTLESYRYADSKWYMLFKANEAGNLESIIKLYLAKCSEALVLGRIRKSLADRKLESALKVLEQIKIESAEEAITDTDSWGELALLEELIKTMIQLGLLMEAKEYRGSKLKRSSLMLFTQPGLQYDLAMQTIDTIINKLVELGLNEADKEELKKVITYDIEEKLLETAIRLNLIRTVNSRSDGKSIGVFTLDTGEKEVGIVLRQGRGNITLIDVKLSDRIIPEQHKWLCDKEFNDLIKEKVGEVRKRIIVYMGESKIHKVDGYEILYINASDWLLSADTTKQMLK